MMLRRFCFLCLLVTASGQSTSFNDLLDEVLDILRPTIRLQGEDQLAVDNVDYDWSYKVLFLTIHGSVSCSNGKVRHLSTIRRTGNATGTVGTDGITIEASVGVNHLQFMFESCMVSATKFFSFTQSVAGTVEYNSLKMKIRFTGSKATIVSMTLEELSGLELTTGTNLLHRLENKVLNAVVKRFYQTIYKNVNNVLKKFEGQIIDMNQIMQLLH